MKLRKHQRDAVKATLTTFEQHPRAQVIMPCGTGKTVVGMHVAHKRKAKRVAVLVPSLALVEQVAKAWYNYAPGKYNIIVVCSDQDRDGQGDDMPADFEGFYVTSCGATVANVPDPVLVCCTYQSSHLLDNQTFDLIIYDEAHRTAGDLTKTQRRRFSYTMVDSQVRAHKRLFMTATPRILSDTDIEKVSFSMDNANAYGPRAYEMTFRAAIEQGLIVDYEIIVALENVPQRECNHADKTTMAAWELLRQARERYGIKRALTFHNRIDRAAVFANMFGDEKVAQWIQGYTPPAERAKRISNFRRYASPWVLSNVRCLGEGVDVPEIDTVVFVDPRWSVVDVVQAIGRAMRLSPGKTKARIIIPVAVSDDDITEARGAFKRIGQIIAAMGSQDSELIDVLRVKLGGGSGAGKPIQDDVLRRLRIEVAPGVKAHLREALTARLITTTKQTWHIRLQQLKQHLAAGDPMPGTQDSFLGRWVIEQRQLYRRNELSADRVKLLEQIPGWEWDVREAQWRASFELTRAAAPNFVVDKSPVGVFVMKQRYEYKKGRLSPERIALLESLPGWTWTAPTPQDRKAALIEWTRTVGHLPDKRSDDAWERLLGVYWHNNRHSIPELTGGSVKRVQASIKRDARVIKAFIDYVETHHKRPRINDIPGLRNVLRTIRTPQHMNRRLPIDADLVRQMQDTCWNFCTPPVKLFTDEVMAQYLHREQL